MEQEKSLTGAAENGVVAAAVDEGRLLETAVDLVAAASPTRSAGEAAERLDRRLRADGFEVERPVADWPESPAVVARLDSGAPGRWLQFNGHLDTVHLPFEPPAVRDGVLTGSGSADMKGGIAAAVEAMRALRDCGLPRSGGILLTAHDHHEAPWGDGRQLAALIRDGYVGDGVLLPEYLADRLPGAGRGMGVFDIRLTRPGEAVHEVLRPPETPDVVAAGAALVGELKDLDARLSQTRHEVSGRDSVFVGQLESGEIFNQAPVACRLQGTRRWVSQGRGETVREELAALAGSVASRFGAEARVEFQIVGEAFELRQEDPLVEAFQAAVEGVDGAALPWADKPFLDDGNRFCGQAGIPAITHGPAATGAHTTEERVPVAELVRVARVYAATALNFCGEDIGGGPCASA